MSGKKYHFEPHHDALLRERYDSRSETIDWLARVLGVPRFAVKHRAQRLGLARTKEKPWSAGEVTYLEANFHRLSAVTIARRLGRTVTAVALKAKRLGIRKGDEGYTATALAEAFGVDPHSVVRWIDRGLLHATKRNSGRERDMYYISDQAVRQFVAQHPSEFDLRKVDQLWFIDLMTDGLRRSA